MTLSFAPDVIETWTLERLRPYARNAKTHGPDQQPKCAVGAYGMHPHARQIDQL